MDQISSSSEQTDATQDFAQVANVPWVIEMIEKSQATLHKTIYEWANIAIKLTDDQDNINSWVKSFHEDFNDVCANYITELETVEQNSLNRIEKSLRQLENFCSQLKIPMPNVGKTNLCLFQEHEQLKKHISKYEILIAEIKNKVEILKKRELELCKSLGRTPISFNDIIPSQTELEEFEEYVNKLESDKFNRLEKFVAIREDIIKIIRELKYNPTTEFEIKVCHYEDNFTVTDDSMDCLDTFHRRLIKELEDVIEESNHLRAEIEQYWNLLDIDLFEREQFKQKTQENNLKVLLMLREEKQRCDKLKKDNIKVFIDKLRNDLLDIWNKCHCNEDIKNDFHYFYTDCYTDDLLELHENELKKWKRYFEENREFLTLLEKYNKLWMKMLELDENATGLTRYNNRGGQLLKEEKERNRLSKQIPKIEEELLELASQYEERTGSQFNTFGQTIEHYINSLHGERENMRKKKLSAKKLQRDIKCTPGGSAYVSSVGQPGSSTKRKLPFTPITELEKKPKLTSSCKSKLVSRKLKIPKIAVTCSTSKRYSNEMKQRINKLRRMSKRNDQTFSSGYGAFQSELSNKTGCRSTLVELEPLNDETFPSPLKLLTPRAIKTPSTNTTKKTPSTNTNTTRKTPKTNTTRRTPHSPKTGTKLTAARSNLKLMF